MTDLNVTPLPFRQTIFSGPYRSPSPKVNQVLLTLRVDLCSMERSSRPPMMLA